MSKKQTRGLKEGDEPLTLKPDPLEAYADAPTCKAHGIKPQDSVPNAEDVLARAIAESDKVFALEEIRAKQYIEFSRGPAGLVCVGDLHFGSSGVDYRKVFEDAELICDTPGLFAAIGGPDLDNFIVEKLLWYQMDTRLTIDDQWVLFRRWLRVLAPKLRLVVSGNHDAWTWMRSGVDYLRDVTASICPDVIYAQDDCPIDVRIGKCVWPGKVRHLWSGSSQWNPSHGMDKAFWQQQGFVWAMGGHDHRGGCSRTSDVGGLHRMAIKCGTYKKVDNYQRRRGYPPTGQYEAVTILFDDETGSMTGIDDLQFAARLMRALYAK